MPQRLRAGPPDQQSSSLGVVARAVPIHHYDGLVTDYPSVMTARKGGHVARSSDEFGTVVHQYCYLPAHVILEVRCFATLRFCDWLDVIRPSPSRFQDQTANLAATDSQNLGSPILKLSNFVGLCEALVFRFVHQNPLLLVP